jgi:GTP pyrophosphokinase
LVSVAHALPESGIDDATLIRLVEGLSATGAERFGQAVGYARMLYGEGKVGTGETAFEHGIGAALILASLNLDLDSRLAALLFAVPDFLPDAHEKLAAQWGAPVAELVAGLYRLKNLRPLTRANTQQGQSVQSQAEILRKMLLALAADIRVVLVRLASRTQTLRWLTDYDTPARAEIARESMEIYAPLANRLGVWQIKWEIEDLSFRFTEPATYKNIAKQLEEKRLEREAFIANAVLSLKDELAKSGVTQAEVYGRPKHIFSIWNKMHKKDIAFDAVYDVRALRIIVAEVRDCYTALGIVHALWQPIHGEFDDYISHPKGNYYRSLHTAVRAEDGRSLEIQIRTPEMHAHAELGVAAHWRYKESGSVGRNVARADSAYDDKIAWLRQLLSWRDEITDSAVWVEQFKRAALDDTIYVITPQGRIFDLPKGATPIDFAYRLHTDIGHRCRGAKVDGHLVPLDTPLQSGQQVEITAAKTGGPSRDWLSPGYLLSSRARQKVKAWFAAQQEAQMLAEGRGIIAKDLQRDGATQANLEALARTMGFRNSDALYLAAARGDVTQRAIQTALHGEPADAPADAIETRAAKAAGASGQILIVGMDKMLTQLGRCCKPVPPDVIAGFVTRGRGVSVHRRECANFRNMAARNPERVIDADWGGQPASLYACDLHVEAADRQGLLRDISEVLSREKVNVTAVKTQSKAGTARMAFTVEIGSAAQMQRILGVLGEISGVVRVRRA